MAISFRFKCGLLLSGILILATTAHAQLGIYGKGDFLRYHDSTNASPTTLFYGGGAGAYYNFLHLGPVRVGGDLRGDLYTGANFHYRDVLGGVRVAVKPPLIGLRPYAQASIGLGGTRSTQALAAGISNSPYARKLLYEVAGGLDVAILPHIDFRAVEVGYGQQSGTNGYPTAIKPSLLTVSSGLVVRLF